MAVITISRQYGSDGRSVGRRAAELLGYHYIDKELIQRVAALADVPPDTIEHLDENPEHPLARALRRLLIPAHGYSPWDAMEFGWASYASLGYDDEEPASTAVPDEDSFVSMSRRVLLQLASEEDLVLIGRGGLALSFPRPSMHIRIVASDDYRLRTLMQRDGLSQNEVTSQMRKVDKQRRRFLKRHYHVDGNSPEGYHLVLNTARLGVDGAAEVITRAARRLPRVRPTSVPNQN